MRRLFALLCLIPAVAFAANVTIVPDSPDGSAQAVGAGKVKSTGSSSSKRDAPLYTQQEPTDHASYVVAFNVAATAAMDVLSIGAPNGKVVRLRRIVLVNPGSATGAIVVDLALYVAAGIGSGGTDVSAAVRATDADARPAGITGGGDPVFSTGFPTGLARTGDTTTSGGTAVYSPLVSVSVPATAAGFTAQVIYDARDPQFKPITLSRGGNSIVVSLRTPIVGAGAAGLRGYAEFTVDDA